VSSRIAFLAWFSLFSRWLAISDGASRRRVRFVVRQLSSPSVVRTQVGLTRVTDLAERRSPGQSLRRVLFCLTSTCAPAVSMARWRSSGAALHRRATGRRRTCSKRSDPRHLHQLPGPYNSFVTPGLNPVDLVQLVGVLSGLAPMQRILKLACVGLGAAQHDRTIAASISISLTPTILARALTEPIQTSLGAVKG
jgi:hypothetical protein